MKTIITIISICFLSNILLCQKVKISVGMGSEKKYKTADEKIKKSTFLVGTNYDKEFDAAVKFAFDKYGKYAPLNILIKKKIMKDPLRNKNS